MSRKHLFLKKLESSPLYSTLQELRKIHSYQIGYVTCNTSHIAEPTSLFIQQSQTTYIILSHSIPNQVTTSHDPQSTSKGYANLCKPVQNLCMAMQGCVQNLCKPVQGCATFRHKSPHSLPNYPQLGTRQENTPEEESYWRKTAPRLCLHGKPVTRIEY